MNRPKEPSNFSSRSSHVRDNVLKYKKPPTTSDYLCVLAAVVNLLTAQMMKTFAEKIPESVIAVLRTPVGAKSVVISTHIWPTRTDGINKCPLNLEYISRDLCGILEGKKRLQKGGDETHPFPSSHHEANHILRLSRRIDTLRPCQWHEHRPTRN